MGLRVDPVSHSAVPRVAEDPVAVGVIFQLLIKSNSIRRCSGYLRGQNPSPRRWSG
jgi:hypothetical protein